MADGTVNTAGWKGPDSNETARRAVVEARPGQDRVRLNEQAVEQRCRVASVTRSRLLELVERRGGALDRSAGHHWNSTWLIERDGAKGRPCG